MGFLSRFFDKPLTEDRFAQLVQDILRRAGDDRLSSYDKSEFSLRFTRDGKPQGSMFLRNIFAEYQKIPKAEQTKWLSSRLAQFANPPPVPEEFEDAAHDLRPSIRSRFFIESVRLLAELEGDAHGGMTSMPLSEYLAVSLVYDLPNSICFVTDKTMTDWKVSIYEAFERARQNLEEMPATFAGIDRRVFISAAGDSYDAARMLMLSAIRSLPLESSPVALPMTRECLLIAGQDDPKGLGMMLDLAEEKLEEPRPLCFVPHVLRGDDWEPWLPAADHPHFERFRLLKLRHEVHEYAEQKHALDKLHEKTGNDVFVAKVLVGSKDDQPVHTIASWAKGITSWLPRTEQLAFFDPATKVVRVASWDSAQRIVGGLMTPLDLYPPRWSVSGFPTEEQFDWMGARLP
jgi:hypothetical protein